MAQLLRRFNSLALNKTSNGHGLKSNSHSCTTASLSGLGNLSNFSTNLPSSCKKHLVLGSVLGQGAVGTVYKAFDGQNWQAVKVVPLENFAVCSILSIKIDWSTELFFCLFYYLINLLILFVFQNVEREVAIIPHLTSLDCQSRYFMNYSTHFQTAVRFPFQIFMYSFLTFCYRTI